MVIRIRLTPADYETLNHRARLCRHRLETYVKEVLACTAADLRQPIRFRTSREQVWEHRPPEAERPENDPDDHVFSRLGRSVTELNRLHERAMARK